MSAPRILFRYYGGKGILAPWIVGMLPAHRTYVEPFCGAASVLFAKERSYAEVLNDKSAEVVNLFSILRDEATADRLIEAVFLTPYSLDEYHSAYAYSEDPLERARRFLVRSAMGFFADSCNRANPIPGFRADVRRRGGISAHSFMRFPDRLRFFVDRLRGVVVHNMEALDIIRKYDRDDTLFYIDPPYVKQTRTQADHHQYECDMDDREHERLVELCLNLQGKAVVSHYAHPIYDRLADAGWRIETRLVRGKEERLAIKD